MSSARAYEGIKDGAIDNDSLLITSRYNHKPKHRTGFLGYRDLPKIIGRHVEGKRALDYGCGTGYSTKILADLNFITVGVDISERMLSEARENYKSLSFKKIDHGSLPFDDNFFDLVLSTFVLFDIPSFSLLELYLKEAQRVLKPQGKFIAATASEYFHKHNWLTAKTDCEANQKLTSENSFKVYSVELDVHFNDFVYTHDDYLRAFRKTGLSFEALYQPLGKNSDGIVWETEWDLPPFSIYVSDAAK